MLVNTVPKYPFLCVLCCGGCLACVLFLFFSNIYTSIYLILSFFEEDEKKEGGVGMLLYYYLFLSWRPSLVCIYILLWTLYIFIKRVYINNNHGLIIHINTAAVGFEKGCMSIYVPKRRYNMILVYWYVIYIFKV